MSRSVRPASDAIDAAPADRRKVPEGAVPVSRMSINVATAWKAVAAIDQPVLTTTERAVTSLMPWARQAVIAAHESRAVERETTTVGSQAVISRPSCDDERGPSSPTLQRDAGGGSGRFARSVSFGGDTWRLAMLG